MVIRPTGGDDEERRVGRVVPCGWVDALGWFAAPVVELVAVAAMERSSLPVWLRSSLIRLIVFRTG
jgi:hypothetical protein